MQHFVPFMMYTNPHLKLDYVHDRHFIQGYTQNEYKIQKHQAISISQYSFHSLLHSASIMIIGNLQYIYPLMT